MTSTAEKTNSTKVATAEDKKNFHHPLVVPALAFSIPATTAGRMTRLIARKSPSSARGTNVLVSKYALAVEKVRYQTAKAVRSPSRNK